MHFASKVSAAVPDLHSCRPGTEAALWLMQNMSKQAVCLGTVSASLQEQGPSRAGRAKQGQGRAGTEQGRTMQSSRMLSTMPHLGYFGVKALPHFNPPMSDQHRAICVNMNQSSSLIQELGGEGNAKLGGDDSQPPLAPPVGLVVLIACLLLFGKTCLADDAIPTGLGTT